MSVAIITGASSGLGREFALQLYKNGDADEFYLIARREDRLLALAEELDGHAKIICADLTKKEGLDKIREALKENNPEVSYLINAAGFGKFGDYSELSDEELHLLHLYRRARTMPTKMREALRETIEATINLYMITANEQKAAKKRAAAKKEKQKEST